MTWLLCVTAWRCSGQTPVTITFDTNRTGAAISPWFSGLSFETQMELPMTNGEYYFRASNKPLVKLFQTLGIKNLRVGGNTADRATIGVPGEADIDSLFAFAEAAGVKVIYTFRLNNGDPKREGQLAKYIMGRYKANLACFEIGNEPNVYAKEYPVYREEWKNYMAAITAPDAAPDAKFCGPSATAARRSWAVNFAEDFGHTDKVVAATQHEYPGGAAGKATNLIAAQDRLLSPQLLKNYEKAYLSYAPTVISNGLAIRIEEANSFYNGGARGVSDTLASALWSLDYMYWWAQHGAEGINFHTGDRVAIGKGMGSPGYASFTTSAGGYLVHPIGYGIKMFDFGGHGKMLPVEVHTNAGEINLTAYASMANDGVVCLTILNKEHGRGALAAEVSIGKSGVFGSAQVIYLKSSNGDVGATTGVTIGGAMIKDDGSWSGDWKYLKPSSDGEFSVMLPPASAVVVKLVPR